MLGPCLVSVTFTCNHVPLRIHFCCNSNQMDNAGCSSNNSE